MVWWELKCSSTSTEITLSTRLIGFLGVLIRVQHAILDVLFIVEQTQRAFSVNM